MLPFRISALAAVAVAALPLVANAAPAVSTANVNLRSGPSTSYPPVLVVPAGSRLEIFGCMQSANWCDVSYRGYRGWMSGSYLQATYSQRRVYVDPQYYRPLGIPSVTFSVGTYWDRHYRNRDFYRDRDRWGQDDRRPPPPRYDRRDDFRADERRRDDDRRGDWRRDSDRSGGFDRRQDSGVAPGSGDRRIDRGPPPCMFNPGGCN
ncbi:SH3 domain-containing protein [Rhizobium sp. RU36D]|uniref:SH3 domain-containing protein n=1 Tax=Rhizobium sp. RU36D TaxID=1907415 RepID=UPI0009D90FBF|nr:SH3 domain-containing protein [Rhizobium sp. RU36D]SMC78385.1 Uncharacterized conserved protein YraI [Rhizobium sp. RU36D]